MREGARHLVDRALSWTPAQPIFRWRASDSLAVIAYHEIRDAERFGAQLDHLRRSAQIVSIDDVLASIDRRAELPPRSVLITFDDGHRDLVDVAMPMLRQRQMPAVAFVVAGSVDTDQPHWWTEVKELAALGGRVKRFHGHAPEELVRTLKRVPDADRVASIEELRRTAGRAATPGSQLTSEELRLLESDGVAVGNHSLTHPCLSRCAPEKVRHEVVRSHEVLSRALGHEPATFAYPDGDRSAVAAAALEDVGYRAAFLFDHRLSARRPADPFGISRLRLDAYTSPERLRITVSGLHPAIHHLRGLS